MNVRKELSDFYSEVKVRAPDNFDSFGDLVGPDLIWVDDEYLQAQPRIAIIGQQVLGWDYTYPEFVKDWEVGDAIEAYRKFDFGADYYSTPFWQFFHQVRTLQHGPSAGRRMVLWTNLVKFVSSEEDPILWKPYRDAALALQDDILFTELRLTTPDICIFVTGPDYDSIIDRYYPGIRYHAIVAPVREFAKLEHPDLPKHSYRCYHPKYLRIGGHWESTINALRQQLGWA
jgi:hypothetical protein